MHVENTPLRDELGDVRFPTPVPKSEGPGAPSSWLKELIGIGATRPGGRSNRRSFDSWATRSAAHFAQDDSVWAKIDRGFAAYLISRKMAGGFSSG